MGSKILIAALAATALMLGTATQAQAWGAYHVGYTHVGYGGVQHYGYTAVRGPYGAYAGDSHVSSYGYHTATYGGVSAAGYHTYTPTHSAGYAAGGYHYAYGTAYRAGVYRR